MEILQENWLARMTRCRSENLEIDTPEVLYISTGEIEAPPFARATISDVAPEPGRKNSLTMMNSRFFGDPSGRMIGIDPGF